MMVLNKLLNIYNFYYSYKQDIKKQIMLFLNFQKYEI